MCLLLFILFYPMRNFCYLLNSGFASHLSRNVDLVLTWIAAPKHLLVAGKRRKPEKSPNWICPSPAKTMCHHSPLNLSASSAWNSNSQYQFQSCCWFCFCFCFLPRMAIEEDIESCGSRACVQSPQAHPRQHRKKLEVYNEVLRRIQESNFEEANVPGFDDQLWLHFNRLPARYLIFLLNSKFFLFKLFLNLCSSVVNSDVTAPAEKTMGKMFEMNNREFMTRNCVCSCPWFALRITSILMIFWTL